jgi:hypothetical protein
MNELDELRHAFAHAHGLPDGAAGFLSGETIAEVETSAAAFARLLSTHAERSEPEPVRPPNILAEAMEETQRRKQELARLFSGRPTVQPRDQAGRYTAADRSFDGGARTPAPTPRSPEADHNALIGQLAQVSRTFRHSF